MKLFSMLLILFSMLFSKGLEDKSLIELFKGNYYSYICLHRWVYINKYQKKNEKLLSLVAYSCLKKNYLTPALDLSKVLRVTKTGRINATYINTLYLMKLLLIQYIKDGYDISDLVLPKVEGNLLAKVFYLTQQQKPKVLDNSFSVKENDKTYKVTFKEDINNIFIEIYKDGKLIKKEKFW
jgi:hypothetical protein